MGIFSFNSPFMALLTKAVNYMMLNLLSLICSLPIVTAGASVTAKYYVAMKMVRGEEPAILKPFFKAFKENFKQSTVIWLIEIVIAAVLFFDWMYVWQIETTQIVKIVRIALLILTIFCALAGIAAFPLIARYQMKTKDIIKASFMFAFLHPFRMLIVVFWLVVPFYLTLRFPNWLVGIWPVVPTLGMFFNAKMFMKQFSKIEEKREEHSAKMQNVEENTEEQNELLADEQREDSVDLSKEAEDKPLNDELTEEKGMTETNSATE